MKITENHKLAAPVEPERKTGLIGNLHPAHVLFLVIGFLMAILTARSGGWGVAVFILMFMLACILFIGFTSRSRHERLTAIWSDLAQQTGLSFVPGSAFLLGTSTPPSLKGTYLGRRVSISKVVQNHAGYEGSIPVVFTLISLEVANAHGYSLTVERNSFINKIFKSGSGENAQLDQRYQLKGAPDTFVRTASQWLSQHPSLMENHGGIIMRTDNSLSAVSWTPPVIHLDGTELSYLQMGVQSAISVQVQILGWLCELAELVDWPGRI